MKADARKKIQALAQCQYVGHVYDETESYCWVCGEYKTVQGTRMQGFCGTDGGTHEYVDLCYQCWMEVEREYRALRVALELMAP